MYIYNPSDKFHTLRTFDTMRAILYRQDSKKTFPLDLVALGGPSIPLPDLNSPCIYGPNVPLPVWILEMPKLCVTSGDKTIKSNYY